MLTGNIVKVAVTGTIVRVFSTAIDVAVGILSSHGVATTANALLRRESLITANEGPVIDENGERILLN